METVMHTRNTGTRLCTTKSMDDVPYLTVCISGVSRQGGGGNGEKEGEYRESQTH